MNLEKDNVINSGIKIIYEDNHLLVVTKPVNMLSQGDNTGDADILSILKKYIKEKYNKPGDVYLGLVHRLDRPVGGVMVFARTSKAASRLSEQIRSRDFGKKYLAVIHGIPSKLEGRLEHYLEKNNDTNIVKVVPDSNEEGKKAILEYKVIDGINKLDKLGGLDNAANKSAKSSNNLSLVEIGLLTGRPHQIRVQFSAIGHPLFGDQKYGRKVNRPGQQIALWSTQITFEHPTKKEQMTFESLPPENYPWILFSDSVK